MDISHYLPRFISSHFIALTHEGVGPEPSLLVLLDLIHFIALKNEGVGPQPSLLRDAR